MRLPSLPQAPIDIYTVHILDPNAAAHVLPRLRRSVLARGGRIVGEISRGCERGISFTIKRDVENPNPLLTTIDARLLEEGIVSVIQTTDSIQSVPRQSYDSKDSDLEEEDESDADKDDPHHPGLHYKWTWTELRK